MMEKKPLQTNVVPEGALIHFAIGQREYQALIAAVGFFARKLVDPKKRELALRALSAIQQPTGFSMPSEAGAGEDVTGEAGGSRDAGREPSDEEEAKAATAPKGFEALKEKK